MATAYCTESTPLSCKNSVQTSSTYGWTVPARTRLPEQCHSGTQRLHTPPTVTDDFKEGDWVVYKGRHGTYCAWTAASGLSRQLEIVQKRVSGLRKDKDVFCFKVGDRVLYDGEHDVLVQKITQNTFNMRLDGTLVEKAVSAVHLTRESADYVAPPEPITEWQSVADPRSPPRPPSPI